MLSFSSHSRLREVRSPKCSTSRLRRHRSFSSQYSRMRSSASTCRWYDARDVWSSRDDSANNCLTRE